ncbi:hypothetical protein L6164_020333 [Bauhinia variegata]|uniref:Uncharacterized protein n=1 Tax=Bauhinia variegata TaxID=167791 RepID=A0ACB9MWR8_BAUVA|nr:hypothetical protein L6164_020333 [Bauhinia variegata]
MVGTFDQSHEKCKMGRLIDGQNRMGRDKSSMSNYIFIVIVFSWLNARKGSVRSARTYPGYVFRKKVPCTSQVDFGFGTPLLGAVYSFNGCSHIKQRQRAAADGSWTLSLSYVLSWLLSWRLSPLAAHVCFASSTRSATTLPLSLF